MTTYSGLDGEPTLADVQREFSGYECWRGISGLCYARLPGRPRRHKADVQGEDPRDLRDQIIRHKAQMDEEIWQAAQAEWIAWVIEEAGCRVLIQATTT